MGSCSPLSLRQASRSMIHVDRGSLHRDIVNKSPLDRPRRSDPNEITRFSVDDSMMNVTGVRGDLLVSQLLGEQLV